MGKMKNHLPDSDVVYVYDMPETIVADDSVYMWAVELAMSHMKMLSDESIHDYQQRIRTHAQAILSSVVHLKQNNNATDDFGNLD